jgi:phage/plasmid primase-like uncharacterized protein
MENTRGNGPRKVASEEDAIRQFLEAASAAGFGEVDIPAIDGIWRSHDLLDHEPGKKKGSAKLSFKHDGIEGVVKDYRTGQIIFKWRPEMNGTEFYFDDAARAEWAKKAAKHKAEDESRRKKVRIKALKLWLSLPKAKADHPYLVRKKISSLHAERDDIRQDGDALVIPLYNARTGEFQAIQRIWPDGGKFFEEDGTATEGCVVSGNDRFPTKELFGKGKKAIGMKPIIVCEGWATGMAIHEATRMPVIAAMSAGNLMAVAKAIKARCGYRKLVIGSDRGKVGEAKANEAAAAVHAKVALPPIVTLPNGKEGKDFNDLFVVSGAEAVRAAIEGAADAAPRDEPPKKEQPAATNKPASDSWTFHWHGEAWSLDEDWLVKGILPKEGKGLMSGQWGLYKTFVALDLAASVMTGKRFAGRRICRRGGVLFIAAEGSGGIKKRLAGLADHKYMVDGLLPFVWIDQCPPLLGKNANRYFSNMAKAAAKELEERFHLPLVLVIVDTLVAAAGWEDENDAAQGQTALNILEVISKATGALTLAVDHFGKDEERGTRGTTSKEGSADFVMALLGSRDLNGKVDNPRLAIRKVRDGLVGFEIPFAPKEITLGTDRDGDPVTTLIIEWGQSGDYVAKPRLPKLSVEFRTAFSNALRDHVKEVPHNGKLVRAVSRQFFQSEFGKTYRGSPNGFRQAFSRELKKAGDWFPVFDVGGEMFVTTEKGPL